jgi:hypothetical protein
MVTPGRLALSGGATGLSRHWDKLWCGTRVLGGASGRWSTSSRGKGGAPGLGAGSSRWLAPALLASSGTMLLSGWVVDRVALAEMQARHGDDEDSLTRFGLKRLRPTSSAIPPNLSVTNPSRPHAPRCRAEAEGSKASGPVRRRPAQATTLIRSTTRTVPGFVTAATVTGTTGLMATDPRAKRLRRFLLRAPSQCARARALQARTAGRRSATGGGSRHGSGGSLSSPGPFGQGLG